jgi:hypothetical protein
MDELCTVCEHRHPSALPRTIIKPNRKEFTIVLCAMCTLFFAGLTETGCQKEVSRRAN